MQPFPPRRLSPHTFLLRLLLLPLSRPLEHSPLLSAQPLALLDTKPVPEYHLGLLEAEASSLREAEHAEEPAEETQAGVEAERARRGDAVHEREVGRADEEVARPVAEGGKARADAAYC